MSNLRWNAHINDIVSRCSKKINMMKQFKYELDRKSLETIYMSFIRPTMEYGDALYAGTYDSDLCKLDRLQLDAMRVVTGATEKSNIGLLYDDLGWSTLEFSRNQHCLAFMYKIVNELTPTYLSELLPQRIDIGNAGRQLRSVKNDLIPVPFTRTETFRRSFFPYTIRLWNKLDKTIRDRSSLDSFKNALKGPPKDKNELFYFGKRMPSIYHTRLRLGCSKLNVHLCYNLHVVPSPQCQCGSPLEDPEHFFFTCPTFYAQRTTLLNTINRISNNINVRTLLYGDPEISLEHNKILFAAVQQYCLDTHMFD